MFQKISLLLALLTSLKLIAGGVETNSQGTKQQGMGHIGVSLLNGSSNVFYNCGSIAFLEKKLQMEAGGSLNYAKTVFYNPSEDYTAYTTKPLSNSGYLYGTSQLKPWLAVGVGYYQSASTRTNWENKWKGRFLVQDYKQTSSALQPTLAVRISKSLGIGLGLNISHLNYLLIQDLSINSQTQSRSTVTYKTTSNTLGLTAGLFLKVNDYVNIGFNYRQGERFAVKNGKAVYSVPNEVSGEYPANNTFSTVFINPDRFNFGMSVKVNKRVTLASELALMNWSAYENQNFDLAINTNEVQDIDAPRFYNNNYRFSLGVDYQESCCLALRFGFAYESSPLNKNFYSPQTPMQDRISLNAGISYDFDDKISVLGAYSYGTGSDLRANYTPDNFSGVYKTLTNNFTIGFAIKM